MVVRKFSICKDFPERQGRDTWRGVLHALFSINCHTVSLTAMHKRELQVANYAL